MFCATGLVGWQRDALAAAQAAETGLRESINLFGNQGNTMRIAVASGKGGTGKAIIATNLAYLAAQAGHAVVYADCDVEEPNGYLFLKPTIAEERSIDRLIPVVDRDRCTLCGRCSDVCRYGAIACVSKSVLVFAEFLGGQQGEDIFPSKNVLVSCLESVSSIATISLAFRPCVGVLPAANIASQTQIVEVVDGGLCSIADEPQPGGGSKLETEGWPS